MQPVLFVSHGSPMLALEPGAWGEDLAAWRTTLTGVKAILVVSAHWEAPGPLRLTAAPAPGTLHDFAGFPPELFAMTYPAPGHPPLAEAVATRLGAAGFETLLDPERPLDHGAWAPLHVAFPEADLPVIQLSLPRPRNARELHRLGEALRPLRSEGVLIVASGGVVHNLRLLDWRGSGQPQPWATAFEGWVMDRVLAGDPVSVASLLDEHREAPYYAEAVPTSEHFDPLFVALGAAGADPARIIHRSWQLGSLSLGTWAWG